MKSAESDRKQYSTKAVLRDGVTYMPGVDAHDENVGITDELPNERVYSFSCRKAAGIEHSCGTMYSWQSKRGYYEMPYVGRQDKRSGTGSEEASKCIITVLSYQGKIKDRIVGTWKAADAEEAVFR